MVELEEEVKIVPQTGNEALLRAIEEFVDPATYKGASIYRCAIGQVAKGLNISRHECGVAEHFNVDYKTVSDIFYNACKLKYGDNYPLFLNEYIRPLLKGEFPND